MMKVRLPMDGTTKVVFNPPTRSPASDNLNVIRSKAYMESRPPEKTHNLKYHNVKEIQTGKCLVNVLA